jgi:site-specific recombinase XerD
MHDLQGYVRHFLDYISLEKNFTQNTIESYTLWMKKFVDFMLVIQQKKFIEEIVPNDIFSFRAFLMAE